MLCLGEMPLFEFYDVTVYYPCKDRVSHGSPIVLRRSSWLGLVTSRDWLVDSQVVSRLVSHVAVNGWTGPANVRAFLIKLSRWTN